MVFPLISSSDVLHSTRRSNLFSMPMGKGQSYRVNSFDLGFINMSPVDIVLQVMKIDRATNELELAFVSAAFCNLGDTGAAIDRWFKEVYPSRSKENCMLKNAFAFERFIDMKFAIPEDSFGAHVRAPR
jgi:hypothetical protein